MSQLTFIDKIQVLFKLLLSSPIIIGIFAFSLVLMILLFLNNRLNKKIIKFIFVAIYVALIGFTVFKYGSYFLTSLDSFVTLFMANIYFPIIPIYVFMMLISFIIMIFTIGSKRRSKLIKIVNTVFFTLIQMLFAIFIFVVESNNIDVSSNENIYTNEQTLTLLELGMGLFVIWVVIISIIYYLKKADKIFKTKKTEVQDDFDEYINDYNEPTKTVNTGKVLEKSTDFNKDVVQSLVPEFDLSSSNNDEVLSFDNSSKVDTGSNVQSEIVPQFDFSNIANFNFGNFNDNISSSNNFELKNNRNDDRKDDDVEIIDFDI